MASSDPQPTLHPPPTPPFQFRLRTLLLLFVVLGSSLVVFGGWGVLVLGLVVGLAVYLRIATSLPSLWDIILIAAILLILLSLLMPAVNTAREAARRITCANNLHQIAMALNAYHQANGCFPPAYVADKNAKPMHSWRLLILPHMDLGDLYKLYNFTQPWDGLKNKTVADTPIMVYPCPSDPHGRASRFIQTSYLAVVGPNTAWAGEKPRKLADFGKDAANTIMLIEVTNSGISWAEPRDLSLDALGPTGGSPPMLALTSDHGRREEFFFAYDYVSGVHVAMADGSVRFLRTGNRSPEDLLKVLQIGGYKEEDSGSYEDFYDKTRRLNWPNIAALAVWLLSVGALLVGAVRGRKARSEPPDGLHVGEVVES